MANNQSISEFIQGFNGGSRVNRFRVIGTMKDSRNPTSLTDFHIRSAALPSSQVGAINVNYRGRTVSFPGDRMYQPWTITVLDDRGTGSAKSLYAGFHDWQNSINDHVDNITEFPAINDPSYHFANDWTVQQLDTNGATVIREFILKNCWPVFVGPIELDMSQDNTLATFAVTLVYSHFDYTSNLT